MGKFSSKLHFLSYFLIYSQGEKKTLQNGEKTPGSHQNHPLPPTPPSNQTTSLFKILPYFLVSIFHPPTNHSNQTHA